jgi:hypothetical protein
MKNKQEVMKNENFELLLKAIIWKFSVLSFGDHFTSSAS